MGRRIGIPDRRVLAVLALVAAAACAGEAPRADAHHLGLIFRDDRPLQLTWAAAQAGAASVVCNVDRLPAGRLRASATGFGFKGPDGAASATFAGRGPLVPGDCRRVTVKATGTVEPGSYIGVLTVTSARAGRARREVTIGVPAKKPAPVAATGATDATKLKAHRGFPGGDATLTGAGELLLKAAGKDEQLKLPRECTNGKDRKCRFLGNLSNGTDVASIYVDGPPEEPPTAQQPPERPAALPLRITGADKVGEYSGALDLAETADPKDDVKLVVETGDGVGWAIFALLLGAGLWLGAQWLLRRSRPESHLRDRIQKFESGYAEAKARFDGHKPEIKGLAAPTAGDRTTYESAIGTAISRYMRSVVWVDQESDAYKQIDASIDQVEADIKCWRDKDGMHAALAAVQASLDELAAFLEKELLLSRAPRLAAAAAAVLKPRTLKVGEAKETVAEAAAWKQVVDSWLTLAREAGLLAAWIEQLAQRFGEMTEEERRALKLATVKLGEALHDLLEVEDAAGIDRLAVDRDLRSARGLLSGLGIKYGWMPDAPGRVDLNDALQALGLHAAQGGAMPLDLGPPPGGVVEDAAAWIGRATRNVVAATSAALRTTWRIFGGLFVIALAFAAGVAAGLEAFYEEPWGTWRDYLSVVVVGAAAQFLILGLVDTVGKLLPPLPDQVVEGPAAAKTETQTPAA